MIKVIFFSTKSEKFMWSLAEAGMMIFKAKWAAYILPHSIRSTLWVIYNLIIQATLPPTPGELGTHFTNQGKKDAMLPSKEP